MVHKSARLIKFLRSSGCNWCTHQKIEHAIWGLLSRINKGFVTGILLVLVNGPIILSCHNLQCDYCQLYCNRGHLGKVDQADYKKIIIHSKNVDCRPTDIDGQLFSGKQTVSPDDVFLFETLHTTPRRHISLTQAVILLCTSNFFAPVAALCNHMRPQVKKKKTSNYRSGFSPLSLTITDLSGNTCFLQWVQNEIGLFRFMVIMIDSCNPTGQLCFYRWPRL